MSTKVTPAFIKAVNRTYSIAVNRDKAENKKNDLESFKTAIKMLQVLKKNEMINDKQFDELAVYFASIFISDLVTANVSESLEKALHKIQSNLWRAF